MIRHEYVSKQIAMRRNVLSDFLQKVHVITFCEKDCLPVIAPIVNMVSVLRYKVHKGESNKCAGILPFFKGINFHK